MPPIVESQEPVQSAAVPDAADALLYDKNGRLTLEAETLGLFLNDVDWDAAFEDEDVQEHIEQTLVLGREVEDPETGAIFLEVFEEADPNATDEELEAWGRSVEERMYGKRKMRGRAVKVAMSPQPQPPTAAEDAAELDSASSGVVDRIKEGAEKSPTQMPGGSALAAALQAGIKGEPTVRITRLPKGTAAEANSATEIETVGQGDNQHQDGPQTIDFSAFDGKQTYAQEVAEDTENTDLELCDVPEGLALYVIESVPGAIVAEHVDTDDLLGMFPQFLDELPEDTLEDRARKALFADMLEVDYASMFPNLEGEDLEEAKRLFKKGDFRKRVFKGAHPGTPAHSQRVRQMLAMLAKGAIMRAGAGKGYHGGGYKYGPSKSGTKQGKLKYARHKIQGIAGIRKTIKQRKVAKSQKAVVKSMIYPNMGLKMPAGWTPPQSRNDLGLGSLYYAIKGGGKKKAVQKGNIKKAQMKPKVSKSKASKPKAKKGGGKSPLSASAPAPAAPVVQEQEGLVKPMSVRTGPHLASLVEQQLTGRKESDQPLTEGK